MSVPEKIQKVVGRLEKMRDRRDEERTEDNRKSHKHRKATDRFKKIREFFDWHTGNVTWVLYQEVLAGTGNNIKVANDIWENSGLYKELDYYEIDCIMNTKAGHFQGPALHNLTHHTHPHTKR